MAAPNSFKDPHWTQLASNAEQQNGVPTGLLSAIVQRGERSNNDQVSSAGAKTVFQITPTTRKLALDKYGVDAYLSPENAADVAGKLLKESLDRNQGNEAAAVREYVGGTNPKNWGPTTRSYVARVMAPRQASTPQGSTFDRAFQQQQAQGVDQNSIANIFSAYQSGKMSAQEAKDFEHDVNSGAVMLPRGAALKNQRAESPTQAAPTILPQAVSDAYASGQITGQERTDLETDIRNGVVQLPPSMSNRINAIDRGQPAPTAQPIIQQQPEPSFGQKLLGAGEAGLSTVTGMTGGALGMIAGTGSQLVQNILNGSFGTQQAANLVDQSAAAGAGALTYQPRTATGQEYAQNVGDVMSNALPAVLAPEFGAAAEGLKAAAPALHASAGIGSRAAVAGASDAARTVTRPVAAAADSVVNGAKAIANKASEVMGFEKAPTAPEAPIAASSKPTGGVAPMPEAVPAAEGATAGTDIATMRRESAAQLPVPIELTKGQATRDFGQLRFEQEAAKQAELGAPIRERMAQQNQAVQQSFDSWIDQTGAQAPDMRGTGIAVDKALTDMAARDKTRIRVAYKDAENSGEMASPVSVKPVVDVLEASRSAESTAPVLTAARREIVKLGGATEDANGGLIAQDMTLANAEQLRKFVNKVTGADPTNIKFAGDIKRAIDASTEGAGGEAYAKARALRAQYANTYENKSVISDLLSNKRGTLDRRVALEDVADRILTRGSLDDMRFARKVLQTGGADGQQAWKEIQGAALRSIKDDAIKNAARDQNGNPIVSASALDKSIRRLDSDGKLDYLFGKVGAEKLRAINELAKVILTTPPGAVNSSNTASVLLAAMDGALSGTAGLPLPVLTILRTVIKNIKNRKLRAQIQDALHTR